MDGMDERPLPPGWQSAILGEVCLAVQKVRPQDEPDHSFTYLDIASIDNSDYRIVSPKIYSGANAPSRARQRVRGGNTLFSTVRTYLKNIAMVPPEFDGQVASTGFCVLNPSDAIDPRYVFYHMVSDEFVSKLNSLQRGTSYPAVRDDDVLAQRIDLPPLPEQRRIVAEIEKQFTRLDASVAALRRTEANLKRYRASVLRAACSGELVPTEAELARAEGREYEPADVLLERILAEHRARWESQEKRRGKYKEPAAADTSDLPPVPAGWAYTSIEPWFALGRPGLKTGPFGSLLKKHEHRLRGVPVLGIENIQRMKFVAGNKVFIDHEKARQLSEYSVDGGDILISRSGTVGETCVVPDHIGEARLSTNLMRLSLDTKYALPQYFCMLFQGSSIVLKRVSALCSGSTRDFLNGNIIKSLVFPVPPLAEQQRIVTEVERRLSVIEQAEAAVEASLQRAERLRQSILKRAFSGELAPQNPEDEPASVLLERIRAQREAEQAASTTKKRPARRRRATPKAQQLALEEASE